jgi:hypothetical protein
VGKIGGVKQLANAPKEEQIYTLASQSKADAGPFAPPDMLTGKDRFIVLRGQLPPEQMTNSLLAVARSIDPQLQLTQEESMNHVIAEGQASRCAPRRWPFAWHLIRSGPDWCYFPAESDQGFVR